MYSAMMDEPSAKCEAALADARMILTTTKDLVIHRLGDTVLHRADLNLRELCHECFREYKKPGITYVKCPRGCGACFCNQECLSRSSRATSLHLAACQLACSDAAVVGSVPFAKKTVNLAAAIAVANYMLSQSEFGGIAWVRRNDGVTYFMSAPVKSAPDYCLRALAMVLMSALGRRPSLHELDMTMHGFVCHMDGDTMPEGVHVENIGARAASMAKASNGFVDLIECLVPNQVRFEPMLQLSTGGYPGTEVSGSNAEWLLSLAEYLEVTAVLKAVRDATIECGTLRARDSSELNLKVWKLFTSVISKYENYEPALPCNDFKNVTSIAAAELLFRGPSFEYETKFALEGRRFVTTQKLHKGDIVAVMPVHAAMTSNDGGPGVFGYRVMPNALVLQRPYESEIDIKTGELKAALSCFLITDGFLKDVFGKSVAFLGPSSHEAVQLICYSSLNGTLDSLQMTLYGGIWPCLRASRDLRKGYLLGHLSPQDETCGMKSGDIQEQQASAETLSSSVLVSSSQREDCRDIDNHLASVIEAANALAREQRKQRRKGGTLAPPSPTSISDELADVILVESARRRRKDTKADDRKAKVKAKQRTKEEDAKMEFWRHSREARIHSEAKLQNLEILEIEDSLQQFLKHQRRQKSADHKRLLENPKRMEKLPGSIVEQLFFKH